MNLDTKVNNVTGVILAGGKSTRMGVDKATVRVGKFYLIEFPIRALRKHFEKIIVVTNERLAPILRRMLDPDINIVKDIYPGHGALGGIYTGLTYASTPYIFVTACDMPFINGDFVNLMLSYLEKEIHDVIIPRGIKGYETLYAIYRKTIKNIVKDNLLEDRNKIISFFPSVDVLVIPYDVIKLYDKHEKMFLNINTKKDLTDCFS